MGYCLLLTKVGSLELRKPMKVYVDYNENQWSMTNSELHLIASEDTYEKCFESFCDEFLFAHKEYGLADDAGLSKDAIKLKSKIKSYLLIS